MGKSNSFTKADWVSIFGMFVYLLLSALGWMLYLGNAWLAGLLSTLGAGLFWILLRLLKKIKAVENNIKSWRICEYLIFILVFVIYAISLAWPLIWSVTVELTLRNDLKESAEYDIICVEQLFKSYESQELEFIDQTRNALVHYRNDDILKDYVKSLSIGKGNVELKDVETYCNDLKATLLPPGSYEYTAIKSRADSSVIDIKRMLVEFIWIPAIKKELSSLGNDVHERLTALSKRTNEEGVPFKFSVVSVENDKEVTSLWSSYGFEDRFRKQLEDSISFYKVQSWGAVAIALLVYLWMFFAYFISNRSSKVMNNKHKNNRHLTSGVSLFD